MTAHSPELEVGPAEPRELVGDPSTGEGEGERIVFQCLMTEGESLGLVVTIEGMADISSSKERG
jgi:hypothetical protein